VTKKGTVRKVTFRLNGELKSVAVHPMQRLLDTIREDLGVTGPKEGCGEGECGACTVFVDGKLAVSCLVPTAQVEGREVTTVEALAASGVLHPIQQAFITENGAQCGFCTPGMLMAAVHYMRHPEAAADLREALAGNQCRCTGYTKIFEAVLKGLGDAGDKIDVGSTHFEGGHLTRVDEQ
jgi:carbon-monoxide dehydrogenase small subunit